MCFAEKLLHSIYYVSTHPSSKGAVLRMKQYVFLEVSTCTLGVVNGEIVHIDGNNR